MARRRVVVLCPHLTPYNDFLFRRIADALPGTEVVYRNRSLGSHPWKSSLGTGYELSYERRLFGLCLPTVTKAFRPRPTLFLVEGWESPTAILLLSLLRLLGRDFLIWTDTPNLDRRGPWLRETLRSTWLRWIFRGARANMGTGLPGIDGLRTMGAPASTLVNFPFVLDGAIYRRGPRAPALGRPMRFVSSGRLQNGLKGHDIAIRAFSEASRRTNKPFKYLIAGTGPDIDALRSLCRELGVAGSVELLGWMEPGDLQGLLRSSDVLVHPSPAPDPFPNAVLEGMAAGMAVLGSRCCGSVVDRVVEGESGMLHEPGGVSDLAEDIAWCLDHPEEVERMGREAERTAARWPVERSVDIIRDLADGRFPQFAQIAWPCPVGS